MEDFMYIGRCVYNILSKLAERVTKYMKKLESVISVVMVTIPIAFVFIFVGIQQTTWQMKTLFGVIGFGLLGLSAWEYKRTQGKIDGEEKTQKDEDIKRHNELIQELKGIREDLRRK
jgi:hypothetical protein